MPTRLRFIDATRALFLVQGVVFHSLLPFHEAKRWAVSNPESISGIAALTEWMHSFRMQGFFLISGLLSWRLLQRSGTSAFLRIRMQRVLIPLVVVLLTANLLERSLIARHHQEWGWRYATLESVHFGALWFLAYLALFTAALPAIRTAVATSQILRRLETWSPKQIERALPVLFTVGSVLIALLTRTAPAWWYGKQFGFLEPAGALMYGGYFMAGALLTRTGHASVLSTRPSSIWWATAIAGWVVIQTVSGASFRGAWMLYVTLGNVYAIVVLRLIFWSVAQLVRTGGSRWDSILVESSYTVYLLHQLVVIAATSTLAWVPWPPLLKLPIIITVAFSLPFAFHRFFVEKSPWLAFLINGTPLSRAPDRSTARATPTQGQITVS